MIHLDHRRSARSWRAGYALAALWVILLAGYVWLDVEIWIVAVIALFTLPAAWDIATARDSGLTLTDREIKWHSGRHVDQLALAELALVRLDRRWDGSMRVTLVTQSGQSYTLPQDAAPPHAAFESALDKVGIPVQRHPFSVF